MQPNVPAATVSYASTTRHSLLAARRRLEELEAASHIARYTRGFLVRCRNVREYDRQWSAAITIGRFTRGYIQRWHDGEEYLRHEWLIHYISASEYEKALKLALTHEEVEKIDALRQRRRHGDFLARLLRAGL